MLQDWLAHWQTHGWGYWIAEDQTGRPVGCAGVKLAGLDGREVLNLYYRFDPVTAGSGLGREAAREAVAFAAEWLPALEITAVIRQDNAASVRTAIASGLSLAGETRHAEDLPEWDPSLVYQAPRFEQPSNPLDLHDELLDLWCRVNAAGGAVGFMGAVSPDLVSARLSPHLESVVKGSTLLGTLREPATHKLLGFAFLELGEAQMAHVSWMKRLMTSPDSPRRNLGRILVAGIHALGRERGIEISRLSYRGGTALGEFYARCGYVQVGRVPGALRFGNDSRDDFEVAMRLDGVPLEEGSGLAG